MAGKSRKQGSRPSTPKAVPMELPKGHLGLKSSPFAPTDCKLTSQYMVVDHMSAHYRKLNTAKSAIDNKPPKAWMVSQKVRDQARRSALKTEGKRRDKWVTKEMTRAGRSPSRASSDVARDEMLAMMEGLEEYDEIDYGRPPEDGNTTMEVHISDGYPDDRDMAYVNKMVGDNRNSPSKYHGTRVLASNIPPQNANRPSSGRQSSRPNSARNNRQNGHMGATQTLKQPSTPKSADLLDTQSYKFTDEKAFQPRINRTTAQSKLSTFKYYNAPKKTPRENSGKVRESRSRMNQTRPITPLTDSVDLMNASLMSRDLGTMKTPTGVPPLDISLDKDHLMWLKEQSKKAQLRSTYVSKENGVNEGHHRPSNSHGFGQNTVTSRLDAGEEELKYLEFIQEVTNDVLDRGIFTNRVLKQVFNSHLQRRKHDLKVSRMRELLEELRQNLGIPLSEEDVEPGVGLTSTLTRPHDRSDSPTRTLKFADPSTTKYIDDNMNDLSLDEGPAQKSLMDTGMGGFDPMLMTTKKFDMATLRQASRAASQSRSRSPSPGTGRPPLPKARGKSRGNIYHDNSREEDDGLISRSYTSLEDMDESRVISKQDEDFHVYKEPPPSTSSILGPGRHIEPIEELRETARTDATSVADYQEDYEDFDETHRSAASSVPKPTPRKRSNVGSRGSPVSTVRSAVETDMDTYRSDGTARSREGSARSREGSARSREGSVYSGGRSRSASPASKVGTVRSRSITPPSNRDSPYRSRSATPKSGPGTPSKGTPTKGTPSKGTPTKGSPTFGTPKKNSLAGSDDDDF